MICPKCSNDKTMIVDSRSNDDNAYRRRFCSECGHRFTTVEIKKDEYDKFKKAMVALETLKGVIK